MYLLMTITDGRKINFVAKTKRALRPYADNAQRWRLNDGNGWCDGSHIDVWKDFSMCVDEQFTYVI